MSSPIATKTKGTLEKWVIQSHQKLSHNKRINYLSALLVQVLDTLPLDGVKLLDIGCGDMSIAENLMANKEGLQATCLDTYPLPEELKEETRWKKYVPFDGRTIPFEDKTFDVAVLCDVLHHDFEYAERLIQEAYRVAKYVVIKDHFEYGMISRQKLRLMDFVGNWGYGVSIPDRYFSSSSYEKLITSSTGIQEIERICPIPLYQHNVVFNVLFPGKLQFISVLERQ
ncbi:MAG: class I SAM-dependent methyltransferase [Aureispira sp.]